MVVLFDKFWSFLWRVYLIGAYQRWRDSGNVRMTNLIDQIEEWHIQRVEKYCPNYEG